jgi:hypothetical protein
MESAFEFEELSPPNTGLWPKMEDGCEAVVCEVEGMEDDVGLPRLNNPEEEEGEDVPKKLGFG